MIVYTLFICQYFEPVRKNLMYIKLFKKKKRIFEKRGNWLGSDTNGRLVQRFCQGSKMRALVNSTLCTHHSSK